MKSVENSGSSLVHKYRDELMEGISKEREARLRAFMVSVKITERDIFSGDYLIRTTQGENGLKIESINDPRSTNITIKASESVKFELYKKTVVREFDVINEIKPSYKKYD